MTLAPPFPEDVELAVVPDRDRVAIVGVGEHREPTPVGPGKKALIKPGVQWRR